MSALTWLSPTPVLRLLAAPRAFVVLLGSASWALGVAWMGAMARFGRADPTPAAESAVFGGIVAAMFLFGVPALAGVVVGEAAQELFRRPVTSRLPGARRRVGGAGYTIGAAASLLAFVVVQLTWPSFGLLLVEAEPALLPCPLATLSVALLGYAAGSWLLVRVGYSWTWLLRFGGFLLLAFLCHPLLQAGSRSTPVAVAVAAVALCATHLRYRPESIARLASRSVATVFGSVRAWGDSSDRLDLPPPRLEPPMPAGVLGRDVAGWIRARSYEHRALNRSVQNWSGFVFFAALPLVIGLGTPIVGELLRTERDDGGVLAACAAVLLGEPNATGARSLAPGLALILGMTMAAQAFVATYPLCASLFRPVSRQVLGRVAGRVALRVGLVHNALTLVFGLVLGFALLFAAGRDWTGGVPAVAIVVAANLVLYPWMLLGALHFRRAVARRHLTRAGFLFLVPAFVALQYTADLLADLVADDCFDAWPVWAGAALATVAGFAFVRFALERHYRRADLV